MLVTRPEADARRTAERLAARGHEALLGPVLRVEPTGEPPPAGPFDAVAVTSANAARALAAGLERIGDAPCFAVGERSARACREAGVPDVRAAGGDAAAVAALILSTLPGARRVLHAAGRDRKPEPAATLRDAGLAVTVWSAYKAEPVEDLPETVRLALTDGSVGAVLHYSRRSAAVLADLARTAGLARALQDAAHLCLSDDAAEPLRALGAVRLTVAPVPDEDHLLDALDRLGAPGGSP